MRMNTQHALTSISNDEWSMLRRMRMEKWNKKESDGEREDCEGNEEINQIEQSHQNMIEMIHKTQKWQFREYQNRREGKHKRRNKKKSKTVSMTRRIMGEIKWFQSATEQENCTL